MYGKAVKHHIKEYRNGTLDFINTTKKDRKEETTIICVVHVQIPRMRICLLAEWTYTVI